MPSVSCCFLHVFTSQKINIKWTPNATKLYGDFLWTGWKILGPGCTRGSRGGDNLPGCARRPRRALEGVSHLGTPWTASSPYKFLNIPKPPVDNPRSEILPPQASVAIKNQSRPRSGTLLEGGNHHQWPSSSSRRPP